MPRREVIAAALAGRGALIEARDLDEVCVLVNRIAPEHLELAVAEAEALLPKVRHEPPRLRWRWPNASFRAWM